jgi:hypothetical protein
MLEEGRYASITEIAKAEKIDRGYVGTILRLTLRSRFGVAGSISGGGLACPGRDSKPINSITRDNRLRVGWSA